MNLGRTLRLFLTDGTPNGIVIAEIINWSGQVFRIPRALLGEFLRRTESNRTAVYLLIGDDDEVPGRLRVYVGESDNVGKRLRDHINDEKMSFWEFACVITSKDQNLTKTHALFIEGQIIDRAIAASRATLDNSKVQPYQSVPESDFSDMTYFFQQISVLLPALGVELFTPPKLQPATKTTDAGQTTIALSEEERSYLDTVDSLEGRRPSLEPITGGNAIEVILRDSVFNIEARGRELNGEILVLEGSQARGENQSEANVYGLLRSRLIKEGKIIGTNDSRIMVFNDDVLFNSPSAASAVILDRNDNGRASWREKSSNKSLNNWYADQANMAKQAAE